MLFDKKKNFNIKSRIELYKDAINRLEKFQSEILSKKDELQDSCSHDLILCYGIGKNDEQILKSARCLTCGNYYELDGTFDTFTERDVNKDSIIDITNILETPNRMIRGRSMVYLRAKDKLEELLRSKKELSLEEVKMMIINDLIMYERNSKVNRLEKVKID